MDKEIVPVTQEESIRQKLEAAFNVVSQLPEDWQTAIWTPLVELFPTVQAMQAQLIAQRQQLYQQSLTLIEQQHWMADLRDRLEKARKRSVESVIAEATIQMDVSAESMNILLDILKGDYAGLLGKYRMQDIEDFINEITGDVYEYQQLNEAEARQLDPDFDPEDDYDPR